MKDLKIWIEEGECRMFGQDEERTGRKFLFVIGVATVGIMAAAAFFFAAGYIVEYIQEYLKYASLQGTGIVLERDGLSGLIDWIRETEDIPEHVNVSYFQAELREKDGEVYDFRLTMEEFDEEDEYVRDVWFTYDSSTGGLETSEDVVTYLAVLYDPNAEAEYVDAQFKRIPLSAQMREVDFDRYTVEFQKDRGLLQGTPVIDGTDGDMFPVLTWEEYEQCAGGVSDGSSQVIVSLTDGTGAMGQRIEYLCAAADEEALGGHPETVMQVDYRIDRNVLTLTDDHGETWIPSGLTEDEVADTLDIYRNGDQIPENSFCADGNGTFAVFYGGAPILRVLTEEGAQWTDIPFEEEFPRGCIARVIRFLDDGNWYAALGTDWSMGTGGATYVYWTHDAGETWTCRLLPDTDALLLTGLEYTDTMNGMLTMEGAFGGDTWPHVYITEDGGENFKEIEFPWDTIGSDVTFINKVDSLVYENGVYTLILGQGSYGNMKARFTAETLDGEWTFEESYIGTVHTWG